MKPKSNTIQYLLPTASPGEIELVYRELLGVIGEDDVKKPSSGDYDDWTVCDTCDVILDDLTSPEYACICDRRNELRKSQRVLVNKLFGKEG